MRGCTVQFSTSGCDTKSKIEKKKLAFQTAEKCGEEYPKSFVKPPITKDMVSSAEKFLTDSLSNDKKVQTFDELRYQYQACILQCY